MSKNILVTGHHGFIGSHFVKYILDKDENIKVVGLDNHSYAGRGGNFNRFVVLNKEKFIDLNGDITDDKGVVQILKDYYINAIINFAAESHVDRSLQEADIFYKTNVEGVRNLAEQASKVGIEKFLQVSTDEVYGPVQILHSSKEIDLVNPTKSSNYAVSKMKGELVLVEEFPNLIWNITRGTNNFGTHQYPEKFIPTAITHAVCGLKVPIYGDGKQIRDWLFVEDHCRGIWEVVKKGKPYEIYNMGGKNELENIDVLNYILNYLDKNYGIKAETVNTLDRQDHDRRYSVDTTKIERTFNFKPSIQSKLDFFEMLGKVVDWYVKNPGWWIPLRKSKEFIDYFNSNKSYMSVMEPITSEHTKKLEERLNYKI